ncbi:hypothetical protein BH10BAC2_BH10BAC2_04270 [soil metagenome]
MKIYLYASSAARFGGLLNGNFQYLYRVIQNNLDNSDFKSSFEELRLTLSYPP